MKTIDERIKSHEISLTKLKYRFDVHTTILSKIMPKIARKQRIIENLKAKKAKEEHTVPEEVRQEVLTLVNSGATTPGPLNKIEEKKVI